MSMLVYSSINQHVSVVITAVTDWLRVSEQERMARE